MKNNFVNRLTLVLIGLTFFFGACSTVPVEVVELSYRIGEDISEIQNSYMQLIHDHFEVLRQERLNYLENEWTPKFIEGWIEDGRLIDVASGNTVWSQEKKDFVSPTVGEEKKELLNTVMFWSQAAIQKITKKRSELLDSLNMQESQLSFLVSDAFNRIYRGNSVITAHLNSLRKVQEVQDNLLEGLNIKDLRDKINNTLITSSDKAKEELKKIKETDGFIK
jgi:hypothetical protein